MQDINEIKQAANSARDDYLNTQIKELTLLISAVKALKEKDTSVTSKIKRSATRAEKPTPTEVKQVSQTMEELNFLLDTGEISLSDYGDRASVLEEVA